ncbi:MAG TPA: SusC/RagA family protein, partial [Flavobacteriaceae bacterium]|nr:SusC/RagA family protein [Flavobacteriaceae bacterium]
MKKIFFSVLLSIFAISAYAQEYTISGVVTSQQDGLPLPTVSVVIKNTTKGTVTDFDGNYTINNVQKGETLVFSYLGFETKEIVVNNSNNIDVALTENVESLSEVVVIGYGSLKKREVTGAVSTVNSEVLEEIKPIKVEQALQGTVSGVNVTQQGGAPGAGLDIRIRGISTNGANGPLVIIDGYQGSLDILNPNDIDE